MPIVEVRNVTKKYKVIATLNRRSKRVPLKYRLLKLLLGSTFSHERTVVEIKALDNVSLDVMDGEIFGLYGKNGSGKTTLLLILGTVILPDEGEVRIFGLDAIKMREEVRKYIVPIFGWMRELREDFTARQNIELALLYHDIDPRSVKGEIEELAEKLEIADRLDDRVERFSSGMKIKTLVIPAIITYLHYERALMLCDEPFVGLDAPTLKMIRDILKKYTRENFAVVLATHQTRDLEILCDRVALMDRGKILAVDSVESLKRRVVNEEKIVLEYYATSSIDLSDFTLIEGVKSCWFQEESPRKDSSAMSGDRRRVVMVVEDARKCLPAVIEKVFSKGSKILYVKVEEPSLEEVLLSFTESDRGERGELERLSMGD